MWLPKLSLLTVPLAFQYNAHYKDPKFLKKNEFQVTHRLDNLVFAGEWHRPQGTESVVFKCAESETERYKELMTEAYILTNHPTKHFVQLHGMIDTPAKSCLVLKKYDLDLRDFMLMGKKDWKAIRFIAREMIKSVIALQEQGLVHHDIKPENFLIDKAQKRVVLTDFALATQLNTKTEGHGTPKFMAPERFRSFNSEYSSDVYSLGVSLLELFTSPLEGDDALEGVEKLALLPSHDNVPATALMTVFENMLSPDPTSRPKDLTWLLDHPWLN